MEHDLNLDEEKQEMEDIIYSKIVSALNESKNILHKKSLILIKSINSQYGNDKLIGIDGVQLYTKTFIDLLLKIVNKYTDIKDSNGGYTDTNSGTDTTTAPCSTARTATRSRCSPAIR